MRLVERMTLDPARCLHCGAGNIEDEHGNIGPFLDLDVEVGWGDSVYLCPLCIRKMALLFEYMTEDDRKDYEARIKNLEKQLHETKATLEARELRLSNIIEGSRALKEERKERGTKKKVTA